MRVLPRAGAPRHTDIRLGFLGTAFLVLVRAPHREQEKVVARAHLGASPKRKEVQGSRCPWVVVGIIIVGEVVLMGAGLRKWPWESGLGETDGEQGAQLKTCLTVSGDILGSERIQDLHDRNVTVVLETAFRQVGDKAGTPATHCLGRALPYLGVGCQLARFPAKKGKQCPLGWGHMQGLCGSRRHWPPVDFACLAQRCLSPRQASLWCPEGLRSLCCVSGPKRETPGRRVTCPWGGRPRPVFR